MAGGIIAMQSNGSSRRDRPSSDASIGETAQGLGWVPVALGLTALAGVTALAIRNGRGGHIERRYERSPGRKGAQPSKPEVERSITIGRSADELHRRWRDPDTLARVMDGFATVSAVGDDRMHWKVEGPLGRAFEWDSEVVDQPGKAVGWRSLPDAAIPNEGWVRFGPAPADRGSVATLFFRFDPPGGALGDAAAKLVGGKALGLAADGVLRRFKSLVETGEIPTLERQPAARADPR